MSDTCIPDKILSEKLNEEMGGEDYILYRGEHAFVSEASLESVLREISDDVASGDGPKAVGALQEFLQSIATSVGRITHNGKIFYRLNEIYFFFDNWLQAYKRGDYDYLIQPRGLKHSIVSVEEFTLSKEYLGQEGYIRPAILKELKRLFAVDHYIEALASGGIGVGKNFWADCALCYMVYRLSCFKSPQVEFGLSPGSSIIFILQSVTHELAKKVVFKGIRNKILDSPYFQKYFPPDPNIKSELLFPHNISVAPISGADTSALGQNAFGGIIDEVNFMAKTKGSAQAKLRGETEYDKAKQMYLQLVRRMKSRFMMRGGKLPGKLLLVASANYPGDFTDTKIEEAKTDKTIFVMNMAQWEAHRLDNGKLDPRRYCGDMFLIDLGDERKPARIIKDICDARSPDQVIEVPVENRKDFEKDMDAALRDIAGRPRARRHNFFSNKGDISAAEDKFEELVGEDQLFRQEEIDLSRYSDTELPELINMDYLKRMITDWHNHAFIVKEPEFAVHIDAGVTQDACGIAIGRCVGLSADAELRSYIKETDQWRVLHGLKAPVIVVDGLTRVIPPPGDEIDLEKVQGLVFALRNCGVNIRYVSMDSFGSVQFLQNVRKHKDIKTKLISVDRELEPYMSLKLAMRERRLLMASSVVLRKELDELQIDRERRKVDHPDEVGGTKDIADALCGVVTLLTNLRSTYMNVGEIKLGMREELVPHMPVTERVVSDSDSEPGLEALIAPTAEPLSAKKIVQGELVSAGGRKLGNRPRGTIRNRASRAGVRLRLKGRLV